MTPEIWDPFLTTKETGFWFITTEAGALLVTNQGIDPLILEIDDEVWANVLGASTRLTKDDGGYLLTDTGEILTGEIAGSEGVEIWVDFLS